MEPITYEAVQRNPELLQALINKAHQERAETVHRLIVQPIKALFAARYQAPVVARRRRMSSMRARLTPKSL
jgi:hypothetical protein